MPTELDRCRLSSRKRNLGNIIHSHIMSSIAVNVDDDRSSRSLNERIPLLGATAPLSRSLYGSDERGTCYDKKEIAENNTSNNELLPLIQEHDHRSAKLQKLLRQRNFRLSMVGIVVVTIFVFVRNAYYDGSSNSLTPSLSSPSPKKSPKKSKKKLLGGDRDEHGCIPSAGEVWCENLHKCIQPFDPAVSGECSV